MGKIYNYIRWEVESTWQTGYVYKKIPNIKDVKDINLDEVQKIPTVKKM